jgi:hypothetical protein
MFDFLQDLMGDIHGPESVDFRYDGGCIEQDGFGEFFQFQPDGVDFRNGGIGKGDGLFAVGGFDVEGENVQVLGVFNLMISVFLLRKSMPI